jgi:hypothetical protein
VNILAADRLLTNPRLYAREKVLGQLGNRVQHALRAFTPRDQKAVRTVADTMRPNPGLDIGSAITELEVGEALISLLDERGTPGMTQRALIIPPASRIGPINPDERQQVMKQSLVADVYEKAVDRESAYEILQNRAAAATAHAPTADQTPHMPSAAEAPATAGAMGGILGGLSGAIFGSVGPRGGKRDGMIDLVAKSASRSVGSAIGREIVRGVLGSFLGGSGRRRR